MFLGKKTVGIIPARGGSKRLPQKNILPLAGRPLLAWSIEAARRSQFLDAVVVSTDDLGIANVARDYLVDKVIERPDELASDTATTDDVLIHAIKELLEGGEDFGYFAVLQPTSPLRMCHNIDEAFELMDSKSASGVISVCETDHPLEFCGKISPDGFMDSFFEEGRPRPLRSQDSAQTHRLNGAIYIGSVKTFLLEKTLFLNKGVVAYVMERNVSIDIDDEFDFKVAEYLIEDNTQAK